MSSFESDLAAVFRQEGPGVTASLIRMCGDFDAAEDAIQDAFAVALDRWPIHGMPENPGGWIMTTAKRRLLDKLRRGAVGETKERLAAEHDSAAPDDRLTLLFTCCHPAISLEARVALTLRTICGLTTEEIANAFLVSTETMAKRLVRAKRKIRVAQIAYEVPDPDHWEPRMSAVLATIYLAFNRGYDLGAKDWRGIEMCEQAIGVGRLLDLLVPNEPEIEGLLSLMLFTQVRAAARVDRDQRLVLLEDQDQKLWDPQALNEARRLVSVAMKHGSVGQYWIQAAIAAEHTAPNNPAGKNWETIVMLYDKLLDQTARSPVVQLNRALAVSELAGPKEGLRLMEGLDAYLLSYAYLPSARAELHRRAGNLDEAAQQYRHAIALTKPGPQRTSLSDALEELGR